MAIQLIDKIKQKNNGTFKLVDASDINWDAKVPGDKLPEDVVTDSKMNTAISQAVANAHHLKRVVLNTGDALPTTGNADTIYMKSKSDSGSDDVYDEYMWINNRYELIGNSKVDLSGYATKGELTANGTSTLAAAKSYADTQREAAKTAAASDASAKTSQALANAKAYTDREKGKYLPLAGGTLAGRVSGVVDPQAETDIANKRYVDDLVRQSHPTGLLTEADFAPGTTKGTFKVRSKEVGIKGLGSAAYVDVADIEANILTWKPLS